MKTNLMRFFLPPAYAVVILLAPELTTLERWMNAVPMALFYLAYAYIFAGLPALAFAWIMGRLQRRGFRHGGVRLLTAMLLGLAAGVVIALTFSGREAFTLFLPLGLATGLLVELTVVAVERHRRRCVAHR